MGTSSVAVLTAIARMDRRFRALMGIVGLDDFFFGRVEEEEEVVRIANRCF